MKRRNFIKTTSAFSLPFFVGGNAFTAIGKNKLFNLINQDNDKVLVLIQLQGGNDGLSTLIPLDQYAALTQVRSNVLVPESSTIKISDKNAFHPSMNGMAEVWNKEKLNIIQGVAYPDQNRSHFRSTDIWHTASEPDEFLTTGWMGRYFDLNYSNYPEGYPNEDCPDPFALTIGTIVSETCQGVQSNFSLTVTDPFNPGTISEGVAGESPDNCYGRELDFVRDVAKQTNVYAEVISDAANKGNSLSSKYTPGNNLASKLQQVARLISGGMQTKIYVVQLGGFDLHSGQVENNNVLGGRQSELLANLSDAICAFQDDCELLGIDQRVVGMTYSEFGRRIRSNESLGTDHGTAAPLFVFGSCVNPTIIGENPSIDNQVSIQEGVAMQFDFRSIYASIMMDWFGVEESQVKEVLFKDFQHLPIIRSCEASSTDELTFESAKLEVYPNPTSDFSYLNFNSNNEHIRIALFDAIGSQIKVVINKKLEKGSHKILIETQDLSSGNYFIMLQGEQKQKTVKLVKV